MKRRSFIAILFGTLMALRFTQRIFSSEALREAGYVVEPFTDWLTDSVGLHFLLRLHAHRGEYLERLTVGNGRLVAKFAASPHTFPPYSPVTDPDNEGYITLSHYDTQWILKGFEIKLTDKSLDSKIAAFSRQAQKIGGTLLFAQVTECNEYLRIAAGKGVLKTTKILSI